MEAHRISSVGGDIDVLLACPETPGPHPTVIVLHEAFGIVEHTLTDLRRFAHSGYVAVAPNLYAHGGPLDVDDRTEIRRRMFELPDAGVVEDIVATADWARSLSETTDSVGCVGFCTGARHVLLASAQSAALDAGVAGMPCYIRTAQPADISPSGASSSGEAKTLIETTEARPVPPLRVLGQLRCPVLAIVSSDRLADPSAEDVEGLRLASASDDRLDVEVVEDVEQIDFFYHRPVSWDVPGLWARVSLFLEEHLRKVGST